MTKSLRVLSLRLALWGRMPFTRPSSQDQDQDQDHSSQDQDQDRILLAWDRSCNKTKVSDHITVMNSPPKLISCADVDECSTSEDRVSRLCHGLCTNVEGSYICSCPLGYRMAPDGRTCQGVHPFRPSFCGNTGKRRNDCVQATVSLSVTRIAVHDRASRSDWPRYCVTTPIGAGYWPLTLTLTFNSRRAIVMIHTRTNSSSEVSQKIDWKQTEGQTDRQTDGQTDAADCFIFPANAVGKRKNDAKNQQRYAVNHF